MSEGAFLIGPAGQIFKLTGQQGTTPECPQAIFGKNDTVRIRRLKHLKHLPEIGAIAAIVPPGFSPDWAWDDLCGRPRCLMHQVPAKHIAYIVAFEGDTKPHLLRERYLVKTDLPPAEIGFAQGEPK